MNVLDYRHEQPVRARHGMVVSIHHLASDAGLEVLKAGGNAVDAAVATGFALAVVHPCCGNLGGGGFMLLRTHDGKSTFIDYREKAPLAATETMYQDAKGNVLPWNDLHSSILGYRSIATPGSVAGLVYAERKYGKLGLTRVMAPAIGLAARWLRSHRRRSQRADRPRPGEIRRLQAHLSARRQPLQRRRNLQAAGAGAHPRAHRRRPRGLLPRQAGA